MVKIFCNNYINGKMRPVETNLSGEGEGECWRG
jgi:hypothetical protein